MLCDESLPFFSKKFSDRTIRWFPAAEVLVGPFSKRGHHAFTNYFFLLVRRCSKSFSNNKFETLDL
jgi:hypothetical protein